MTDRQRHVSPLHQALAALRLCFLACLGSLLTTPLSIAQAVPHFGHQAWTTEDGLPQNSVHQILQTRDGYLWIATEGGLARFDGLTFTTFHHDDHPEMPSDDIACLTEDQAGALWIGTTDGLLRYANGRLTQVSLGTLAGPSSVTSLAAADDGSLLVLTPAGLTRILNNQAFALAEAPAAIATLSTAPDHTVWLTTASSLLEYTHGHLIDRGHLEGTGAPHALQIDPHGTAWLLSSVGIISQPLARAASPSQPHAGRSVHGVAAAVPLLTTFLVDDSGQLWLGTKRGLFLASTSGAPPTQVAALGDRSILSLSRDQEGDLWVGTEADGLHILRSQKVEQLAGLQDHVLTALAQTTDGTLWLGTRDDGLRVYKPSLAATTPAATAPHLTTPLASQVVLALAAGDHNDVWVGTLDGLNHVDHGSVDRFSSADGLPDDVIRSLLVGADHTLWIGTRHGLVHWQGTRGAPFVPVGGLANDLIGAMLVRHSSSAAGIGDQSLWVATLDGLSRVDKNVATPIPPGYKFGPDAVPAPTKAVITSMAEDAAGTLWIGTRSNGLAAITPSGLLFLPGDALPRNINSLLADTHDRLWLGTPRGIFRVAIADLRPCLVPSGCAPPIARFGYADGMPTEETTASGHPAALRTADGSLWFATTKGIARINPAAIRETSLAPPVVLERFLVDNQAQPLTSHLRLPFAHTSLTFDYAGLSFSAPARVRYRYRLEGFDKQWTEAGVRRTAYYTNLPPGSYTFRVQAANSDGIWNRTGGSLAFTILQPFYRRVWFYLLVALVLASVAYGLYYLRVRRLRSEFDAVLAERNRIAREIHDTLAQNFVGISIQLQIAEQLLPLNNPAAISEQLRQTRELVQEGLNDARQSIWELRASVAQDSLPTRISRAAERAARDGVTQHVHIGGIYRPLDAAVEKEVLRVAQEALANVTRHAHATQVNIELRYDSDHLQLSVVDNGTGFDPDAVFAADDHFGLQGMRERATGLAATLSITSAPGDGTSVRLTVPLPRSERRSA